MNKITNIINSDNCIELVDYPFENTYITLALRINKNDIYKSNNNVIIKSMGNNSYTLNYKTTKINGVNVNSSSEIYNFLKENIF